MDNFMSCDFFANRAKAMENFSHKNVWKCVCMKVPNAISFID